MDFAELTHLGLQAYVLCGLAALAAAVLILVTQQRTAVKLKVGHKPRGTAKVLFVGPMNSGKTSFFGRLVYKHPPSTHTSMAASTATLDDTKHQVVDLPGHPRLRSHLLAQYLPSADGVVFFIDPSANATATSIQTTAEHLHVVLSLIRTLEVKNGRTIPLLILLSKSDSWSAAQRARAQDRVRSSLERELEKRRQASTGMAAVQARLDTIDELPSGGSGNPFSFRSLFQWSPSASSKSVVTGGVRLPEDEQEILQSDVFDYTGPFSWDFDKLGITIDWATASSKPAEGETWNDKKENGDEKQSSQGDSDGTSGFWKWLDERVL